MRPLIGLGIRWPKKSPRARRRRKGSTGRTGGERWRILSVAPTSLPPCMPDQRIRNALGEVSHADANPRLLCQIVGQSRWRRLRATEPPFRGSWLGFLRGPFQIGVSQLCRSSDAWQSERTPRQCCSESGPRWPQSRRPSATQENRQYRQRDRIAPIARLSTKAGENPRPSKSRSGGALVDVADRDALYHAMEGR